MTVCSDVYRGQPRDVGASCSGLKERTFPSRAERRRSPCWRCWVTNKGWRGWRCSADPIIFSSSSPGSLSHSLCYFYLHLPEPSQGLPQSFLGGYLDDQPIARLDSLTGKMEPLVPWMEEKEKEKENFLTLKWIFRADLEKLSKLRHQSEGEQRQGLHTWQAVWGCELREDGSKGGFLHYGYDGMDFISFNKETLRWVAAQPQAQKVKEKWEEDPWWSEKMKNLLENNCNLWLQRYLSYQNKTVQRTGEWQRGFPLGMFLQAPPPHSISLLHSQAFGFHPKEIQATWTRDGEPCVYETLHKNVAPNSDGTYYVQLTIDIDPKERDHFRCHLEHEGLQEPLILVLYSLWGGLPSGGGTSWRLRQLAKGFHCSASPLQGTQHLIRTVFLFLQLQGGGFLWELEHL
uniref:Immunoglobulin C1-set domain-containing protein n=1 Tax=Naja naja TaxID=35670 RepID=A0A8C6VAN3_NAJNA